MTFWYGSYADVPEELYGYATLQPAQLPKKGRLERVISKLVFIDSSRNDRDGKMIGLKLMNSMGKYESLPLYMSWPSQAKETEQIIATVKAWPVCHSYFTELPIYAASPEFPRSETLADLMEAPKAFNPSVHDALQDLGYQLAWDIHEACPAINDPDMYYPGVDEGIDLVTDDHVELVIAAMQRELERELRGGRPAFPLDKLPWRVQRALAERRRLRMKQWGIDREAWERGTWSLWDIEDDPEWTPAWPE